jgi:SNF2 family DNA or RNA helicase
VAQWINEISKCIGLAQDVVVDFYDFSGCQVIRRRGPLGGDADIVLTTYTALEYPKAATKLHSQHWGRIVLDEMQEIRSTTTKVAKMCEKLSSSRRWILSGTPLFDGIADLRGELNFLALEPFAAGNEDGFFDFMIQDPWECRHPRAIDTLRVLSSVMLRRSKSMSIVSTGLGLLENLPSLTVTFVPVEQSASERALYYFLESIVAKETNVDATGRHHTLCLRLLRDLCVSPVSSCCC